MWLANTNGRKTNGIFSGTARGAAVDKSELVHQTAAARICVWNPGEVVHNWKSHYKKQLCVIMCWNRLLLSHSERLLSFTSLPHKRTQKFLLFQINQCSAAWPLIKNANYLQAAWERASLNMYTVTHRVPEKSDAAGDICWIKGKRVDFATILLHWSYNKAHLTVS